MSKLNIDHTNQPTALTLARNRALAIVSESTGIGAGAALLWLPRAMAAIRGIGKNTSAYRLVAANRGFFPFAAWSLNRSHQMGAVFLQMSLNTATHRTAEEFTHNKILVAGAAASGAVVGTFRVTANAARIQGSLFRLIMNALRTPQQVALVATGFACEWTREWGYNEGCLNLKPKLDALELPGWAAFLLTGLLSGCVGYLTGPFHAFASRFYHAAIDPKANVMPKAIEDRRLLLRKMHQSSLWRMGAIGGLFVGLAAIDHTMTFMMDPPSST